ncbi:MAG: hypothetical protein M1831_002076 [Alyxoria varia]|nr:MAG: hypothetical protein M1831_002076 [Alyxoria varia]
MPFNGQLASDEDIHNARNEGLMGALNGAATWGIPALFAGFVGYHFSPIYRNLTFQFKLYLQMSAMTVGGTIEADRRFREAEKKARRLRRLRQDQEAWRRFEADYEDERLK